MIHVLATIEVHPGKRDALLNELRGPFPMFAPRKAASSTARPSMPRPTSHPRRRAPMSSRSSRSGRVSIT